MRAAWLRHAALYVASNAFNRVMASTAGDETKAQVVSSLQLLNMPTFSLCMQGCFWPESGQQAYVDSAASVV